MPRSQRGLRFASWNIGHYSLGKSAVTTVATDEAVLRGEAYRRFLKQVGADFVGVCEYSEAFDVGGKESARQAVFGDYPQQMIGPSRSYQWNAQFWNGPGTDPARSSGNGWIVADFSALCFGFPRNSCKL